MKKKFASFLVTGKAATLPFFAGNSLAHDLDAKTLEHFLKEVHIAVTYEGLEGITPIDIDAAIDGILGVEVDGCLEQTNVVITGLKGDDIVFLFAANKRAEDEGGDPFDPSFKLGVGDDSDVRFVASFMVNKPDPAMPRILDIDFIIQEKGLPSGGGLLADATFPTMSVSVPLNLMEFPNPEGIFLQAAILRGDGLMFSDRAKIGRKGDIDSCNFIPFDPNAGPGHVGPGAECDLTVDPYCEPEPGSVEPGIECNPAADPYCGTEPGSVEPGAECNPAADPYCGTEVGPGPAAECPPGDMYCESGEGGSTY